MTRRTARERLLFEARKVGPEVTGLEGVRSHTASIESSGFGPSRLIRISCDGSEVCKEFSLEVMEDRPEFYPSDVPFFPSLPCTVLWDDEDGVYVKWSVPLSVEETSDFPGRLEVLFGRPEIPGKMPPTVGKLEEKAGEERIEIMSEALRDHLESGLPEVALSLVAEVMQFFERRGWTASREVPKRPWAVRVALRGEGRRLELVAMSLVVTLITLTEQT